MVKPIKSEVRELLYNMISKFQDVKEQHDVFLSQKRQCLKDIDKLTCGISDELKPHLQVALRKLKALEELTINSENQYMIASMTEVSEQTLRVIKNEGQNNQGIWRTSGKKRAARVTKVNIDNFDQCAIRNTINQYYLTRKEVPTLRKLLLELRQSIDFTGCRETLRKILLNMGFEFKKYPEERTVLWKNMTWRHGGIDT